MLDEDQQRRYARQRMLDGFGETAQSTLGSSSVLVIGAGGLGSATLSYLAAAGVGRIGIIDHDHVELSHLHRQIIHEDADINRLKVESAADRISELNPHIAVDVYAQRITEQNARAIISRYDLLADGCDRFDTRLAVNAACWAERKTLVSASALGYRGQLLSVSPAEKSACYQCLVPEAPSEPDRCSEVGVLGPLCGIIGSMQATEIIKQLTGIGENLTGRWLRYDALNHTQAISHIRKNPSCAVCR
jgi:molybdopterin/thiamine biosynthesis adenylyltransferase